MWPILCQQSWNFNTKLLLVVQIIIYITIFNFVIIAINIFTLGCSTLIIMPLYYICIHHMYQLSWVKVICGHCLHRQLEQSSSLQVSSFHQEWGDLNMHSGWRLKVLQIVQIVQIVRCKGVNRTTVHQLPCRCFKRLSSSSLTWASCKWQL